MSNGVPGPKYRVLAEAIKSDIRSGVYAPGDQLPSVRTLAAEHGDTPTKQALRVLAEEGWVYAAPGSGTFVANPLPVDPRQRIHRDTTAITEPGTWRGLHAAVLRAGHEPWAATNTIREVPAPADVADKLGIPVTATVIERARIHGLIENGRQVPVQLSWTWIPLPLTAQIPALRAEATGKGGILARLEEAGHTLGFEDVVSARLATPGEWERLELPEGAPVLVAWRRAFSGGGSGEVLEVTLRIADPARHELIYRYA